MFYHDIDKDFTLFSTGKQATTSMYKSIYKTYRGAEPKIEKDIELYHPKDKPSIPCYIMHPIRYVELRQALGTKENYIVIREPVERLVSGIVENIFLYYWSLDEMFSGDLDSIPEHLFNLDDYHVAPYLSHLSPVINCSTFIDMGRLSDFVLQKFKCPLLLLHTNRRKSLRSPRGLISGNDMCNYVSSRIVNNDIPKDVTEHLSNELEAYRQILQSNSILL